VTPRRAGPRAATAATAGAAPERADGHGDPRLGLLRQMMRIRSPVRWTGCSASGPA
jgi:hypothetical protein